MYGKNSIWKWNRYFLTIFVSAALTLCTLVPSGAAVNAAEDGEGSGRRIRMLDPENEDDLRVIKRHYPDGVPEGFKVEMEMAQRWSDDDGFIERMRMIVPVNEEGERHGVAIFGNRRIQYENGVRHGYEREHRQHRCEETGRRSNYVYREIPWEEGQIHGTMKLFHPDGSIQRQTEYVDGEPVGETRAYTREGNLLEIVPYEDGQMHGVRVLYFPDTDVVRRKVPYNKGSVDGVVREFYPNGQLRRKLPYRNEMLHGIQEEYDEEGNRTRVRYWLDGDMVPQGRFDREYDE